MSNVVLTVRVWAAKDASETAKASRRKAIFLSIREPLGGVSGISERASCFAHRTLLLPSTPHMYQQSEPQRDQGADGSFYASDRSSHFPGQVPISHARLSECGSSRKKPVTVSRVLRGISAGLRRRIESVNWKLLFASLPDPTVWGRLQPRI